MNLTYCPHHGVPDCPCGWPLLRPEEIRAVVAAREAEHEARLTRQIVTMLAMFLEEADRHEIQARRRQADAEPETGITDLR